MKPPIWLSLTLAGLLVAPAAFAKAREDFERVIPFSPGGTFEIENQNGSIVIQTWDEDRVRIEAEKVAESEDRLDDLEILIEGSGDSVSVETHKRRSRWSDYAKVDYVITLPVQANVDASTANGSVTIEGIHGRVEAKSTNGELKIEDIAGEIEARTTNGSIRAHYVRAVDGRHEFETTNGSVRIYLPSDAGGDFEANTVNGSIDIDFPTNTVRASRRHMEGSFGSGNGSFDIETVNGSVKILQH